MYQKYKDPPILTVFFLSIFLQLLECHDALGMASGSISDRQISASSEYNTYLAAKNGRLHNGTGWSADTDDASQWLQIDFGVQYPTVTRVATQGSRAYPDEWVTEYKLEFSNDGGTFQYYVEQGQVTDKVRSNK